MRTTDQDAIFLHLHPATWYKLCNCQEIQKVIVSVYFRCPIRLWVSLEHTFTCVYATNQAEQHSSTAHLLARWEHERTTARWSRVQGGGPSVIATAGIHYKLRRLLTGV